MLMHLRAGHVTATGGDFTPVNFPQSDLGRRPDSRWALPQISSVRCINFIVVACAFELVIFLINIYDTTRSLFIYRHNKH